MALLTPAVIDRLSLDNLVSQQTPFFKKYIFKFALIQGAFAVFIAAICWLVYIAPAINLLHTESAKALTLANFTKASLSDGKLQIDIKPQIWTHTIKDEKNPNALIVIAVDSLGTMNSRYWDDRTVSQNITKVSGVGFMKDSVHVKLGNKSYNFDYHTKKSTKEFSKTDVKALFDSTFSAKSRLLLFFVLAIASFLSGSIVGAFLHLMFSILVGGVLALFTNSVNPPLLKAMKVSSGLYVFWGYLLALFTMTEILLYATVPYQLVWTILQTFLVISTISIGIFYMRATKIQVVASAAKVKQKENATE